MPRKFKYLASLFIIIVLASVAAFYWYVARKSVSLTIDVSDTAYEMPRLSVNRAEQIIEHTAYTVSYNSDWNIPNWVAYELTDYEATGVQSRSNHFFPDPLVKGDPVVSKDYSNSGYDRGHMAPAGDMKWSEQAMRESFYMTNICPQNHNNNAGDWKDLEELARDWSRQYGSIYIACGPIVSERYQTIGLNHRIAVPNAFYKVFLRRINNRWTTIGFVMPNEAGHKPLSKYAMSVDEVEIITDIDFFVALPDSIEEIVESTYNFEDWNL